MAWRSTNLKTHDVNWSMNEDEPVTQNGHEFLRENIPNDCFPVYIWNHSATCSHPDHSPDHEKIICCCHRCK